MIPTLPIVEETADLSAYAYSYPHKSSYGSLIPAVSIAQAWRDEDASQVSLYIHIPFCEMRCGFCNLFTQSQPRNDLIDEYLSTLFRQMRVIREAVPHANLSQLAIGGGTPTFLSAFQLRELLGEIETTFGQPIRELNASVEVSPTTATEDRLQVLSDFGVERISIGVQSFIAGESQKMGRPQRLASVHQSLERIRTFSFPVLNIDLIYGDPLQTPENWLASLEEALRYQPGELYLYPLYIRPETGLGRTRNLDFQHRSDLYLLARDLLNDRGYTQASLRCFRLPRNKNPTHYGCQRDGMIGLGCGARSYTQQLHYSTRFAVSQSGIREILSDWIAQTDGDLALATHGIWLSEEEQQRRFVILSLLQAEGLSLTEFQKQFPEAAIDAILDLGELQDRGWLIRNEDRYLLTPLGLQHSDTVGPMLYSKPVRNRLREFVRLPTLAESLDT